MIGLLTSLVILATNQLKADIEAIRQLIKDSKKTKKDKNVKYNVL